MQPALELLSQQEELRRHAKTCVGDVNEACMLVHNVMSRAFRHFHGRDGLPDAVQVRMRQEIERLAAAGRPI